MSSEYGNTVYPNIIGLIHQVPYYRQVIAYGKWKVRTSKAVNY